MGRLLPASVGADGFCSHSVVCNLEVTLLTLFVQVLPGTDDETSTQGLDNLGSRCAEYYKQGEPSHSPSVLCVLGMRAGQRVEVNV